MTGYPSHQLPRWVLLATGLLVLAPVACSGSAQQPAAERAAPPPAPVTTTRVERGPLVEVITYSGNVQAESTVSVRPRATGRLERLFVDVGSRVRNGDPVAVLD